MGGFWSSLRGLFPGTCMARVGYSVIFFFPWLRLLLCVRFGAWWCLGVFFPFHFFVCCGSLYYFHLLLCKWEENPVNSFFISEYCP